MPLPQFMNPQGELLTPKDADEAARFTSEGIPQATVKEVKADHVTRLFSNDWANAAFNTATAGALGVARSIPGLTTAAEGYTQLADAAMGQVGAPGSVTETFKNYVAADSEAHPAAHAFGRIAGALVPGAVAGTTARAAAMGAVQGGGDALDRAAEQHMLTPSGAEKATSLLASVALGAVFGSVTAGVASKAADSIVLGSVVNGPLGIGPGAALRAAAESPLIAMAAKGLAGAGKVVAMGAAATGMHGAAPVAGALYTAGKATGNAGPAVLRGLGKAFDAFDSGIGNAVAKGLTEAHIASALNAGATSLFNYTQFEAFHADIANAEAKPGELVPRMSVALQEHGVPGAVADVAAQGASQGVAYLAGVRPKAQFSMTDSVAPVQQSISMADKVAFMDKVNAVHNPTWAIANPNPSRMEALNAVYPVLMNSIKGIVSQQAALGADMTLPARQWAGQITGRPATPMDSPRLQAIRHLTDQMEAMQRQQKAGTSGGGGAMQNTVDSFSTQSERLAR